MRHLLPFEYPLAHRFGNVGVQGKGRLLMQCRLDEGSRQAHDDGAADPKDIEEPGMGQSGIAPRAEILLKARLSGHPAPINRTGDVDQRPGENHHVPAGFRVQQPVHNGIRKKRHDRSPPGAQEKRDQRCSRHVEEQYALQMAAQRKANVVEKQARCDDDAGFV